MKKAILVIIPLVLIGAVIGLAMAGVVNIPGLTPKRAKPPTLYGDKDEKKATEEAKPPKQAPVKEPVVAETKIEKPDAEKGAKKLAQLWNNMPSAKLAEVAKEFQDKDLAPVLVVMDPEKVAELLGLLDSKRSAKLSKELQRVASVVSKPAG